MIGSILYNEASANVSIMMGLLFILSVIIYGIAKLVYLKNEKKKQKEQEVTQWIERNRST